MKESKRTTGPVTERPTTPVRERGGRGPAILTRRAFLRIAGVAAAGLAFGGIVAISNERDASKPAWEARSDMELPAGVQPEGRAY